MPAVRRRLVAANWKMNLDRTAAERYCRTLLAGLDGAPSAEVVIFPSHPLLAPVARALDGSPVGLGGQDLSPESTGAFTGDVSAAQLADAGCGWALCGHSERRQGHGESDALVARKVAAALAGGLVPVACVGETAAERAAGRTFEVLGRQLDALPADPRLALAYEPVWAIGTGQTATPEIAREAHAFLRARAAHRAGEAFAAALRILYGGSVSPDNAAALAAEAELDGALVGGASLDPDRFLAILHSFAA